MEVFTVSQARKCLYRLIDTVAESHDPICVTGKRNKAIIISEDDFKSIQETLYLLSIPGMRDSIIEGRQASLEECSTKLEW